MTTTLKVGAIEITSDATDFPSLVDLLIPKINAIIPFAIQLPAVGETPTAPTTASTTAAAQTAAAASPATVTPVTVQAV